MLTDLSAGVDNTQHRLTRETEHVVRVTEKAKAGGTSNAATRSQSIHVLTAAFPALGPLVRHASLCPEFGAHTAHATAAGWGGFACRHVLLHCAVDLGHHYRRRCALLMRIAHIWSDCSRPRSSG